MRAKIFTKEELEKGYDKMSRDGKEYESISEEELEANMKTLNEYFDNFISLI